MSALVVVDMQNDFMPGGALAVARASEIVPLINEKMALFSLVVATLDWHPPDHASFISAHPSHQLADEVIVEGTLQLLWPVHCVRNTWGSELISSLHKEKISAFFYKGTDPQIDSYSAFFDNAHQKSTGLADYLKSRQISTLYFAGVATDYCVLYSALDALHLGFKVVVLKEACRGINLHPHDVEKALSKIQEAGGRIEC